MKAYLVTIAGIDATYRARSRARATYLAAFDAYDVGWGQTIGKLLKTSKCVRDPIYDSYDDYEGAYTLRPIALQEKS